MAQIDEVIPVMTIKEQLLKEIESAPENLLPEILNFLLFLKTKPIQTQAETHVDNANKQTPLKSTGRSLLEHLKTIGTWEGDDLKECLEIVYATRGKAKFNEYNPFDE
jgi:hypothetical protein